MPVRGVVDHEIEDQLDPPPPRPRDQRVHVAHRPELRVDAIIIGDVIAEIDLRRGVHRRQPHRVDAERAQIADMLRDPPDVADAVIVAVGELRG